jgi:N-methylhydantoinase B
MRKGRLDPVTFEILRGAFNAIAEEMNRTIHRVSLSLIASESRDSMGALYSDDGRLVGSANVAMPAMATTFEPKLRAVLDFFGAESMRDGDVFLINQPHDCGSHLMDMTAVAPVFHKNEIIAFLGDGGHWTDVGGQVPGGFNLMASETYAEGLYITPLQIVDAGRLRRDVVEMILANVRLRDESRGDLMAMLKTLDVGRKRVHELADRYGAQRLRHAYADVWDHAADVFEKETASIPNGEFHAEDRIDEDPLDPKRGAITVRLRMTSEGGALKFDFRESDSDSKGALGISRACLESAVFVGLLNLYPKLIFNPGLARRVEILSQPGTIVHATFPSSVSGGWACAQGKALATVFYAIGEADPPRKVACPHDISNFLLGGIDQKRNRQFLTYLFEAGGMGATASGDASPVPQQHPISTGCATAPIELHERWFPMILHKSARINYASMGAGRYRGGPGMHREMELIGSEATISNYGDRHRFPPWGRDGGHPGGRQDVILNAGRPDARSLGVKFSDLRMQPGDTVTIQAAGGGGFGSPLMREPEAVLRDVSEGILTLADAYDVYGVVIRTVDARRMLFELNNVETEQERNRRQAEQQSRIAVDRK